MQQIAYEVVKQSAISVRNYVFFAAENSTKIKTYGKILLDERYPNPEVKRCQIKNSVH